MGKGWPVIVESDDDLFRIAKQLRTEDAAVDPYLAKQEPRRSPADILAAAGALEFPKNFYARPGAFKEAELNAPTGEWPIMPAPIPLEYFPSMALDMLAGNAQQRVNVIFLPLSAAAPELGSACLPSMGQLECLPAAGVARGRHAALG